MNSNTIHKKPIEVVSSSSSRNRKQLYFFTSPHQKETTPLGVWEEQQNREEWVEKYIQIGQKY